MSAPTNARPARRAGCTLYEIDPRSGGEQIRECTLRAENCAYKAKTAPNVFREDYRMLEKHWMILAQHYLLTLEEAERSYGWASRRTEPVQASSVFEGGGQDSKTPLNGRED
jgi:hypothetical protein